MHLIKTHDFLKNDSKHNNRWLLVMAYLEWTEETLRVTKFLTVLRRLLFTLTCVHELSFSIDRILFVISYGQTGKSAVSGNSSGLELEWVKWSGLASQLKV